MTGPELYRAVLIKSNFMHRFLALASRIRSNVTQHTPRLIPPPVTRQRVLYQQVEWDLSLNTLDQNSHQSFTSTTTLGDAVLSDIQPHKCGGLMAAAEKKSCINISLDCFSQFLIHHDDRVSSHMRFVIKRLEESLPSEVSKLPNVNDPDDGSQLC